MITVRGKTDKVVELNDLKVLVDKRSQPAGGFVTGGCGGQQDVRVFTADLDQKTNVVTAVPQPGRDNFGKTIPAMLFPIPVTAQDPQVFNLIVSTKTCDCTWKIELSWTDGDRTDTKTYDDHGNPFRTISSQTGDYQGAYIDSEKRQFVVLGPGGLPLN
jgi:hypothetical protein